MYAISGKREAVALIAVAIQNNCTIASPIPAGNDVNCELFLSRHQYQDLAGGTKTHCVSQGAFFASRRLCSSVEQLCAGDYRSLPGKRMQM
jgi:hypothetical protein